MVVCCAATGCGHASKPPGPEAARKALKTVLEAWKSGQTQADMTKQSSIHTKDSDWNNGYKLLEYEIAPEEKVIGFNLTFNVKLQLTDTEGNNVEEEATYSVGTSPRVVVVRSEEM